MIIYIQCRGTQDDNDDQKHWHNNRGIAHAALRCWHPPHGAVLAGVLVGTVAGHGAAGIFDAGTTVLAFAYQRSRLKIKTRLVSIKTY